MVVGKLLKYRITEEIQNDVANALREAKPAVLKVLRKWVALRLP